MVHDLEAIRAARWGSDVVALPAWASWLLRVGTVLLCLTTKWWWPGSSSPSPSPSASGPFLPQQPGQTAPLTVPGAHPRFALTRVAFPGYLSRVDGDIRRRPMENPAWLKSRGRGRGEAVDRAASDPDAS